MVAGDDLKVAATGLFADKNVGTAKVVALTSTYSGLDVGNYTITGQASDFANISQKALTISGLAAVDRVYDGTRNASVDVIGANFTGLVAGDDVRVQATGLFDTKNVGTEKSVTLASTYTGADVGNYAITGQATDFASITPKALTISGITALDKVYDGGRTAAIDETGARFIGLVIGDDVKVAATGQFDTKNVGMDKLVTLTSSYHGADVGNYAITDQMGDLANITPRALTISGLAAGDKVYDGNTASVVDTAGPSTQASWRGMW